MTVSVSTNPIKYNLGLLAIKAAAELERLQKEIDTRLESVKKLSTVLEDSFSKKVVDSGRVYRLDHASVVSKALSNSFYPDMTDKSVIELAEETGKIATLLGSETIKPDDKNLPELITFCIALSDSAALHKAELKNLRRRIA